MNSEPLRMSLKEVQDTTRYLLFKLFELRTGIALHTAAVCYKMDDDHNGNVALRVLSDFFQAELANINSLVNDHTVSAWLAEYNNLFKLYLQTHTDLTANITEEAKDAFRKTLSSYCQLLFDKIEKLKTHIQEFRKKSYELRFNEKHRKIVRQSLDKEALIAQGLNNYFIKLMITINAGAVVALLTYLSQAQHITLIQKISAQRALSHFGWGLIFGLVLLFVFFISQHLSVWWRRNKYENYFVGKINFHEVSQQTRHTKWLYPLSIFCCLVLLVWFIKSFLVASALIDI